MDWTTATNADCPSWLRRGESIAWSALCVGLAIGVLLALAAIWLTTLGYDEAWILQGISDAVRPRPADVSVAPVLTTGGLVALADSILTYFVGVALWPKRLFTFACALALGAVVWHWGYRRFGNKQSALLVTAGLIATPGTVVLSATAYGTVPAFLLLALAFDAFAGHSARRIRRIITTGFLSGLAVSTRLECVVVWPALLIATAGSGRERRREMLDATLTAFLGGVVLVACAFAYAHVGQAHVSLGHVSGATGFEGSKSFNYPFYLNKWVVSQESLPFVLAVMVSVLGLFSTRGSRPNTHATNTPPPIVILAFGWLALALWLFRTPIPHLRYLWPASAAFFVALGLTLSALHAWGRRNERPGARFLASVVGLACVIACLTSGFRQIVHGESNFLSWEWSGESRITYFTRFRHASYQRHAAEYLRQHVARNERILALSLNRELGYLAERDVLELPKLLNEQPWKPDELPRKAFLGPLTGNYLYLADSARHWIESNCELEAQFGPYSFYRVTGSYPDDPALLVSVHLAYPGHPKANDWR